MKRNGTLTGNYFSDCKPAADANTFLSEHATQWGKNNTAVQSQILSIPQTVEKKTSIVLTPHVSHACAFHALEGSLHITNNTSKRTQPIYMTT